MVHRIDASGNVLKTYDYNAFGNELGMEPLDTNPFRYCGEYFDRETGTYYLRARNYEPSTGRFTTEDAVSGVATKLPNDQEVVDPLSLNRYTYCDNSPVVFSDSTGNYYVVQENNGYTVVQDYNINLLMGAGLQFLPFLGDSAWSEPNNTIGGTSHGLKPMFSNPLWSKVNSASDFNSLAQHALGFSVESLGTIGNAFGMANSLDFIMVRGKVMQEDTILFALNSFYGLPTTFSSPESAGRQMRMLADIVAENNDYFRGMGGTFDGSQAQIDFRRFSMKNKDVLGGILMSEEQGISTLDVMRNKLLNPRSNVEYLRHSNYAKRTAKLWSALSDRTNVKSK